MANGLFNTQNNAARVMLQMEAERAKRIRDAGAGMDPIVASMARAQQGMRESVGDLTRSGMGLFGKPAAEDPRLTMAKKVDADRTEILAKIRDYASDGTINENEMREGFALLAKKGYMKEAKEFLTMAQSMKKEKIDEMKALADRYTAKASLLKAQGFDVKPADMKRIEEQIEKAMGFQGMFTYNADGKIISLKTGSSRLADPELFNTANDYLTKATNIFVDVSKKEGTGAGYKAMRKWITKNIKSYGKEGSGTGSGPGSDNDPLNLRVNKKGKT
tara:strand:- start:4348 stop:5172 length:825 start_codon:yes stop_codon:yes gene_type:complete